MPVVLKHLASPYSWQYVLIVLSSWSLAMAWVQGVTSQKPGSSSNRFTTFFYTFWTEPTWWHGFPQAMQSYLIKLEGVEKRPPLFHRWPCPKKTKMGLWYTVTFYRRQHNRASVHGGHIWTKWKLASVPGDHHVRFCLQLPGYTAAGSAQGSLKCPMTIFFMLSKHWNEHWLVINLIHIIGMLSGYRGKDTPLCTSVS